MQKLEYKQDYSVFLLVFEEEEKVHPFLIKFDLKEFHMTVLENGSLPLDLLEEIVEDYIAASR